MARKAWGELSPEYRQRLERHGITEASHSAGESIKAARGHAQTPETPVQAMANPQQFPDYFRIRINLADRLNARKQRLFGTRLNARQRQIAAEGTKGHYPTLNQLRWAVDKASDDEIMEKLHGQDMDFSFLFYH